jgi:hypothetical protein
MIIYKLLLRLYPRVWRARYEEEFLAVLTSHPFSFFEGIDVMRGALDAHLHPCLGTATLSSSERMRQMLSTLRCSLLTIFCAYVGFILAGGAFQKMTESGNLAEVARTNSLVGLSFDLVVIGAFIALLAVLVGSLPIGVAVIGSALTHKRRESLLGLIVPFLALGVFLGTLLLLETFSHPGKHLLRTGQVFFPKGVLAWVLIGTAMTSAGAVCFAVTHGEIPGKLLRFAIPPFTLATISMGLVCAATILWGLALHSGTPQIFASNDGPMGSSTTGIWLEIVIAQVCVCIVASVSLLRARATRAALRATTT